jgi:hypothetical protein
MRYFGLLGFQHVVLFIFPALIFIILFYIALSRTSFRSKDSGEKEERVVRVYPGGIEVRNSPFPLILILIIIGFLVWAFFYTLGTGLLGVKI